MTPRPVLLLALALAAAPCRAADAPAGDADGFAWNERAWTLLAQKKLKEASEAFRKAIERSANLASQAEANLGLGIAALARSEPKEAMVPLRNALIQGPYILPIASYETALTALAMGDQKAAQAFLQQSMDVDPLSRETIRQLARLQESLGDTRSSYLAFQRLLALDPGDQEAAAAVFRLSRRLKNAFALASIRRLSQPLLDPEGKNLSESIPASPKIRVALFSDEQGRPAAASKLNFMANGTFTLYAGDKAVLQDGRGVENWQVLFKPETGGVEVRDGVGNLRYEGKERLRVTSSARQPSVLVRNAEFARAAGLDAGDREVRGILEIIPGEGGAVLVNDAPLEAYLYGVVGLALPQGSPADAYKAEAVVARTTALWYQARASTGSPADICDAESCQRYAGVNEEMREATQAVAATRGQTLSMDGALARVTAHQNCGGMTEEGIADGPGGWPAPQTEEQLSRWTREFPPESAYCQGSGQNASAGSRWIRVVGTKDLEARVKGIGSIVDLRAAKRSPTGRVLALEVVGSRGTVTLEGAGKISDFLSPGSLRSTFFTIRPLMKGDDTASFIIWGAGTGSGLGMCKAGAVGQATAGRDYKSILGLYFPGMKVGNGVR